MDISKLKHKKIIGVDEVGRGCLYGPVYAAAFLMPENISPELLQVKDSKKLSKKRRKEINEYLKNTQTFAIGQASVNEIDKHNILNATHIAMWRALSNLKININEDYLVLIDGNINLRKNMLEFALSDKIKISEFNNIETKQIIGGDNYITAISAASVIAKEERDSYILKLCSENPVLDERYGLSTNMGYPTKKHKEGILKFGKYVNHRNYFKINY